MQQKKSRKKHMKGSHTAAEKAMLLHIHSREKTMTNIFEESLYATRKSPMRNIKQSLEKQRHQSRGVFA